MEKNWFRVEDCVYQEERPGEDWMSVEDYQQMAVDLAWERLIAMVPLGAIITFELLERMRLAHGKK